MISAYAFFNELEKIGRAPIPKNSKAKKGWSWPVTHFSHALDLEPGVFTFDNPADIARSLKNSAEESKTRKAGSFQSAMSMLNFYINRAGKNLPKPKVKKLNKAKEELRKLYSKSHKKKG